MAGISSAAVRNSLIKHDDYMKTVMATGNMLSATLKENRRTNPTGSRPSGLMPNRDFPKPLPTASGRVTQRITEREGWVLLKIPRGDIDGVGEVK